ncbi:MAG: hypothetical protein DBY27_02325 [Clostridiaceae bacterium]|nr:MAG: hypothetical protein DBY27_02325 [Clostridiaceae bacterium]
MCCSCLVVSVYCTLECIQSAMPKRTLICF